MRPRTSLVKGTYSRRGQRSVKNTSTWAGNESRIGWKSGINWNLWA
jgi:hypothetical protein